MASTSVRALSLGAVRVLGFVVAVVAGAYGASQVALALITPTVSVPSSRSVDWPGTCVASRPSCAKRRSP